MLNHEQYFFSKKPKINRGKKESLGVNKDLLAEHADYAKESSILQKIRECPEASDILKGAVTGAILSGATIGATSLTNRDLKHKQEINIETDKANKYFLETNAQEKFNPEKFLKSDFIKEVALFLNNRHLIKERYLLLSEIESQGMHNAYYIERLDSIDKKIHKAPNLINKSDEEIARGKIIDILILIDQAKLEVLNHLKSKAYLKKLAKEMNISQKAAKQHQAVRINNVKAISFDLKNSFEIKAQVKGAYAIYYVHTTQIVLPYDIDLNDEQQKKYFYTTIIHEILHESTNAKYGLSETAKNILTESAKPSYDGQDAESLAYYTDPAEMIVRKQILDLEMEKLGLKEYGQKFTEEHYLKLLPLLDKENVLSIDSQEFLRHVKRENFLKVMNELAENHASGKTYHHPEWQSGNEINQA